MNKVLKHKIIVTIIILLIIILIFVGYKKYNLDTFKTEKINITEENKLSISKQDVESNQHIENMGFYLSNEDYVFNTEDNTYIKTNKADLSESVPELEINQDTGITSNTDSKNQIIEIHIIHNIIKNTCIEDKFLDTFDYLDLMQKSSLNTELDLIKYYLKEKDNQLNVIASVNQIKMKYLSYNLLSKLEIDNNIKFIDNLEGLISTKDNKTTSYLFNNGNLYKIIFENIEETEILAVLNTIHFN